MKCEQAQRLVLLDSAGELPRRRRIALQRHLLSCDACRRYAADLEELSTLVGSHLAAPEPPALALPHPVQHKNGALAFAIPFPGFRVALAAAALILLVVAGTLSVYLRSRTGTPAARLVFPDEQALINRLERLYDEVDRIAQDLDGEWFYDPYAAMSLEELCDELMRMEGS
ncbi:MAG TPA: hypothetical protein EYP62_05960 [Kiritimatiellae bacterium]|nr:hypothetical protein [Kiritimatiellia bacterium]